MKKLITMIIAIISFFSILSVTNAWEGYLEKILDLNYGPEEYDFRLENIDYIYFYDSNTNAMYNDFRSVNDVLKDEVMKKYRANEIDYYTMNGIVLNFNKYTYHTNKIFYYISIKEIKPDLGEIDNAITKNYELSRSYYHRVKDLINKS